MPLGAQRGIRGKAVPILNLVVREVHVANATPWPLCDRQIIPVTLLQKFGWALEPVWMGAEKRKYFASAGVRTLNLPAGSYAIHPQAIKLFYTDNTSNLFLR